MKTKIIALVMVAVFSACILAGTAWAKENAEVEHQEAYRSHFIFKWIKLFFRVLKLEKSVSILKEAVRQLNSDLNQETMDRQSGDRRLKLIIDEEAETRAKDDIALGEAIDQEAAAREKGDERLGNALRDEKEARMEADKDLQKQIDSIETGTAKHPIFFSSGRDKTQAPDVQWMGLGHMDTGFPVSYGVVTPMSGEIKDLYGFSMSKLEAGTPEKIFFQLYRNETPTDLKCEITGSDSCIYDISSVAVDAGDKLTVYVQAQNVNTEVRASVVLENTSTKDFAEYILHE